MGRPPSNGGPAFRFNQAEVMEMEAILQQHNNQVPSREMIQALADKFSETADRKGKMLVQNKQVWNWFQNRRYAIRAKSSKVLGKLNVSPMSRDDPNLVRNLPQGPQPIGAHMHAPSAPGSGKGGSDNAIFEFEAKSGRDGAWYDVANFLSHRYLETGDPEVLVRFAGFGPEEDEWVNVRKHVRQRSLPCESSECVAVLPGDLILCFQEGKEQALYFDAHVLDAQRRRHDVRGCRCRFLVRYVHDQSEEIVPLRKVCRRPETDYRLQQLHAVNEAASAEQKSTGNSTGTAASTEMVQKQQNVEAAVPVVTPVSHAPASVATQASTPELRKAEISTIVSAANPSVAVGSAVVTCGPEGGAVIASGPAAAVTGPSGPAAAVTSPSGSAAAVAGPSGSAENMPKGN